MPALHERLRAPHPLLALALLAFAALIACKQAGPPPLVDSGMASCVTGDTVALAGADLEQLRASPFATGMSSSARGLLERYGNASKLLVAWNGSDLLIVVRGLFKTPPPGATAIEPGLAVAGSPNRISSAVAQHRAGSAGAPGLIDYGSEIGARSAIWLAVRGGAALPVGGNLANLNHLLQDVDFAGAALDLGETATLRLGARGRTAESAERLEERLRGFLSLAGEAEIHRPELGSLLGAAQIQRSSRDVTATLSAPPDVVAKLLADFAR
ncbi:MAG: hypothetical protein ABSE42_23280 [Bryobacteraceae bacterium]|jgi:hypothetical protein